MRKVFYLILVIAVLSCTVEKAPKIEGLVYIPEGEFIMGSEDIDTEALGKEFGLRAGRFYEDEKPMRKVNLKGFYIDKYEVTNRQYKEFIDSTSYNPPPKWTNGMYPDGRENHPVNNVTWYDAKNYCAWVNKRLPSEAEWEKAARGPNGSVYPWGNDYDEKKGNLNTGDTTPVGSFETDKSYYGVYDMAGNIMEWLEDWYLPYPGNAMPNKDYGEQNKTLRGGVGGIPGHYIMSRIFARASSRHYYIPTGSGDDAGIRCAKSL